MGTFSTYFICYFRCNMDSTTRVNLCALSLGLKIIIIDNYNTNYIVICLQKKKKCRKQFNWKKKNRKFTTFFKNFRYLNMISIKFGVCGTHWKKLVNKWTFCLTNTIDCIINTHEVTSVSDLIFYKTVVKIVWSSCIYYIILTMATHRLLSLSFFHYYLLFNNETKNIVYTITI